MLSDKYNIQKISLVIPCFNEKGNISVLYSELKCFRQDHQYEIIFVDDGSSDGSVEVIKELSRRNSNVKYLSFSRNFGHQSALLAGLRAATGSAVITMDADLQHPPSMLPLLIDKWREGYDVVNTKRTDTIGIGIWKRTTSRLFYRLLSYLTELDLSEGCADFRLFDRKVVNVITGFEENGIFIRGMVKWCGFRQTELEYVAQKRLLGDTKYSFWKMFMFSISGITAFSIRPLRLSIFLSAILGALCMVEIFYALYIIIIAHRAVSGWTSTVILISLLGTMIMLMLGIVGEYVGRTFMQGKGRPMYIVSSTNTGNNG